MRGEMGSLVVKYGTYETENESGEEQKGGFLKSYTVFNSLQIEGIEFPSVEIRPPVTDTCGGTYSFLTTCGDREGPLA